MNPFRLYFKAALGQTLPESFGAVVCIIAVALGLSLPTFAFGSPLFGSWLGQAQVGERLRVNMTVFGMDAEGQSQLKNTCMEAWAETGRDDSNSTQTRMPLNLDYGRTLDRGGLITLTSTKAIWDPVVRVHLTSNCPLIAFVQVWDLQLDFQVNSDFDSQERSPIASPEVGQSTAVQSAAFNLSKSSTLAASFKKPKASGETMVRADPRALEEVRQMPKGSVQQTRTSGTAAKELKPSLQNQTKDSVQLRPDYPDQQLALAPSRMNVDPPTRVGELESVVLSQPVASNVATQSKAASEQWAVDPALTQPGINLLPFVLFAAVSLAMIAFGVWWGQKHSVFQAEKPMKTSGSGMAKLFKTWRDTSKKSLHTQENTSTRQEIPSDADPGGTDHKWVEKHGNFALDDDEASLPAVEQKSNGVEAFNKQLFESFLGSNSGMNDALNPSTLGPNKIIKTSQDESKSLVSKVYLSQKRSMEPWSLAQEYMSLIPARADSEKLEDEVIHTRIQCEMGLIELAFLTVHQGTLLHDIQIEEMLEMLDPGLLHQSPGQGVRIPSDLIKDFVRAKWCEFSSIQEVELFTESLRTMHESNSCQKLCMAHPSWLEFVNNLEVS